MKHIVSHHAMRPASDKRECYYCHQSIGAEHKSDCVLILKKVKIRMTIEYEVSVPSNWDKSQIEFHRNDGSWCANNDLDEVLKLSKSQGCLCNASNFEYLEDLSKPFLSEI